MEPKYHKFVSKWSYICYGSKINPFYPEDTTSAKSLTDKTINSPLKKKEKKPIIITSSDLPSEKSDTFVLSTKIKSFEQWTMKNTCVKTSDVKDANENCNAYQLEKNILGKGHLSIFEKWRPEDEDSDSEFIIDDKELRIEEQNSETLFNNNMSEKDELLLKIICEPKLEYFGNTVVKRRLTATNILSFNDRDWRRFRVEDHDHRKLIVKYLTAAGTH